MSGMKLLPRRGFLSSIWDGGMDSLCICCLEFSEEDGVMVVLFLVALAILPNQQQKS